MCRRWAKSHAYTPKWEGKGFGRRGGGRLFADSEAKRLHHSPDAGYDPPRQPPWEPLEAPPPTTYDPPPPAQTPSSHRSLGSPRDPHDQDPLEAHVSATASRHPPPGPPGDTPSPRAACARTNAFLLYNHEHAPKRNAAELLKPAERKQRYSYWLYRRLTK